MATRPAATVRCGITHPSWVNLIEVRENEQVERRIPRTPDDNRCVAVEIRAVGPGGPPRLAVQAWIVRPW